MAGSSDDLTGISSVVANSIHHFPGFLMDVVPSPTGLWVSFHPVNGATGKATRFRPVEDN
jgi:hypothetical protein